MLMLVGALLAACLLLSLLGLFALWAMRRTSNKGDDLADSLNKCSSGSESNTLNLTQPANSSYNSPKLSLPDNTNVMGPGRSPSTSNLKLEHGNVANSATANHPHLSHLAHQGQQIQWDHDALLNNSVLSSGNLSHGYLTTNQAQAGQLQLDGNTLTTSANIGPYVSRYQLLNSGNTTNAIPPPHSYVESIYNYPAVSVDYAATNPLMSSCKTSSARNSPQHALIATDNHLHGSNYLTNDGQSFDYGLCTTPVYLPSGYADYAQLIDYESLQQQQSHQPQQQQQQASNINQHSSIASSQISYESNAYHNPANNCTRSNATNGSVTISSPKQLLNLNESPSTAMFNGTLTNNAANSAGYRSYITPGGNLQCMSNTSALATHV